MKWKRLVPIVAIFATCMGYEAAANGDGPTNNAGGPDDTIPLQITVYLEQSAETVDDVTTSTQKQLSVDDTIVSGVHPVAVIEQSIATALTKIFKNIHSGSFMGFAWVVYVESNGNMGALEIPLAGLGNTDVSRAVQKNLTLWYEKLSSLLAQFPEPMIKFMSVEMALLWTPDIRQSLVNSVNVDLPGSNDAKSISPGALMPIHAILETADRLEQSFDVDLSLFVPADTPIGEATLHINTEREMQFTVWPDLGDTWDIELVVRLMNEQLRATSGLQLIAALNIVDGAGNVRTIARNASFPFDWKIEFTPETAPLKEQKIMIKE